MVDDKGMSEKFEIREGLPGDLASIEKLYPEAFPDEDLLPLVRQLLKEAPIVLSLVAITDNSLVGHVIFTTCSVAASADQVALLAPARRRARLAKAGDRQSNRQSGAATTGRGRHGPNLCPWRPRLLRAFGIST